MAKKHKKHPLSVLYAKKLNRFKSIMRLDSDHREKDIHELRVTIKYLRAFWDLIERIDLNQRRHKKLKSEVKDLFRLSGDVRSVQVNQKLLEDFSINDFSVELNKEERIARVQWQTFRDSYRMGGFLRLNKDVIHLLKYIDSSEFLNEINRFNTELMSHIHVLLLTMPEDYLHEVRKILKKIKASLVLAQVLSEKKKYSKRYKRIKRVEEMIGDWHDRELVLVFLEKHHRNQQESVIADMIRMEAEDLKDKIMETLKKEFSVPVFTYVHHAS
jgi:CHAD domain-containing protein